MRTVATVLLCSIVVLLVSLVPAQAAHAALDKPRAFHVSGVNASGVQLRWRAVNGASFYQVYRNGSIVASTATTSVRITGVRPGIAAAFRVRARTSAEASAVTPAAWATPTASERCDYLARPDGSDNASGRTNAPYRTIAKLLTRLAPGVNACIAGSFVEDISITSAGVRGRFAVLRNQPGKIAKVRGRVWVAAQAHDLIVQGLNINGRNANGLPSPTINGDRTVWLENDITNNNVHICMLLGSIRGWGVAEDTVIDGNRIHDCGVLPALNHHHGIYVESSRRALIVNNVIFRNADRGIQLYPDAQGTTISRNIIDRNGEGVIFSGAEGFASSNNQMLDNIATNARLRYNIEYWWDANNPIGTRNKATRNCLWGGRQGLVALPGVGLRYSNNLTAAPLYLDATSGDYRLSPSTGCLDMKPATRALRRFTR